MRTRSKLSILLSILLCCTMLAGLLPTVAFAEDGTTVSSENGADTSSKNGADTTSENGADTSSENGADTTSENGAGTSSENGTAAPAAAPAAAPPAAPSVAWIGETGYPTLEEAVNAAASGDTIVLGEGKFTLYKKVQIQKEKTSHLWGREPIKPHGALVQRCLIRLILGRNTMAIIVSTAPAQSHFGI